MLGDGRGSASLGEGPLHLLFVAPDVLVVDDAPPS